jgi:hypothetical protein
MDQENGIRGIRMIEKIGRADFRGLGFAGKIMSGVFGFKKVKLPVRKGPGCGRQVRADHRRVSKYTR